MKQAYDPVAGSSLLLERFAQSPLQQIGDLTRQRDALEIRVLEQLHVITELEAALRPALGIAVTPGWRRLALTALEHAHETVAA